MVANISLELKSNVSCKVDVSGMVNCEQDGKDNEVKSSGVVICNFGLKVLWKLCEEKVEGIGMKSKGLVEVIDNFVNEDDESDMCALEVEKKSEDGMMSLDSSKDVGTREEISKDIKIDSKSWVAYDSRCEESETINGRMIQDDSKFKVHPDVDPKSIFKGEKINLFNVKHDEGSMEDWNFETLGKVVESKEKEYNQNKPTDIKTTTPMTTDFFMGWKNKMDEKEAVVASQRAEMAKNDHMSGREMFLADASLFVDDAEANEKYHREEKSDNSNQKTQEGSSTSELSTSTSVAVVSKEGLVKKGTKNEGYEGDSIEVIVADIREGGEYETDRKYNKVEICGSSKHGALNCVVTDVDKVLDDANGKERGLYQQRRWIKDLEKETKGFINMVSQARIGLVVSRRNKVTCGLELDTHFDFLKGKLSHLDVKSVFGHLKFLKNGVSLGYVKYDM
ncbi:zinc finger CCCH domain-containing protein 11-like protein [Tanacetum coccineum]|uniref:Zinc finger CCCH domain-containing protein 11-like protein n=1 Tax=Tanacetum coccineum TaxID=301880 RepID=A0ABQ5B058_9ASTR